MPAGAHQAARRAFVTVLLALAAAYGVAVAIDRDSPDASLLTAFQWGGEGHSERGAGESGRGDGRRGETREGGKKGQHLPRSSEGGGRGEGGRGNGKAGGAAKKGTG